MSTTRWLGAAVVIAAGATCSCTSDDSSDGPVPTSSNGGSGGVAGAGGGGSGGGGGAAPVVSVEFVEHSRLTIVDGAGDHLAFPDVARLPDGQLVLVYRRGAGHVDPSGRIEILRGSPEGTSWSPPQTLLDTPSIDDRDPSIAVLADGRVLVDFFPYRTESVAGSTLILHQVYSAISTDGAASFGAPSLISAGPMDAPGAHLDGEGLWVDGQDEAILVWACSSPAVEVAGELLVPVYGGNTLNLGNLAAAPRSRIALLRSSDGGESWAPQPVETTGADGWWLQEPALIVLHDGTWLLQIRTADGTSPSDPGPLAQTTSADDGQTWSAWSSLGLVGHAPNLLQLENGVVLTAFRELDAGYTAEWVSLQYSLDGAATWSDTKRIEDCNAEECGYPSLLELPGDQLLVVYYSAGGDSIDAVIYDVLATRGG